MLCQHQSAAATFGRCCYGDIKGKRKKRKRARDGRPLTRACVSRLRALRDGVVLAVRQEYVAIGDQVVTLQDGDEVAVVPPLSGG